MDCSPPGSSIHGILQARVLEWSAIAFSDNTVQGAANKTIPMKKKSEKAKWLSEEALQIVEEQREVKSKEEREKYIQLKAGFQRIARRDKKTFFNERCLIIEENNKRRKTKDLFRKF